MVQKISKEGDIVKKAMKLTVLCIALVTIFFLSACSGSDDEHLGIFAIEEIQDAPQSFLGEITLSGIVGTVGSRDFTLLNGSATFEVTVDYRGSQALPQVGDEIAVEGRLSENRPCCGPGFTLTSTRFHPVAHPMP